MKLRTHLILFLLIFVWESNRLVNTFGNRPPIISDLFEVHNIAWNLAHGKGYRFDWDDAGWRKLLLTAGGDSIPDYILARRGSHPTMFRPPLSPLVVAGLIRLFPDHSFLAWRVFDCAAFSLAVCLLCEIAYVNGSIAGLIAMLVMVLNDSLLRIFVPGCWTEGLAFDLLCGIAWLLANPRRLKCTNFCLLAGLAVGLLCLDRAVFVVMMLPVCGLLAIARPGSVTARVRGFALILAIAILPQLPWWARNIDVSGRFLPLGTQGGFNLPDEYGDIVLQHHSWIGLGIGQAWTPLSVPDRDIPRPPGFTEESFAKLYDGNRRMQAMTAASVCGSLQSEIAVSDRGTQTALHWIRTHRRLIPELMLYKAEELVAYFHIPLIVSGLIAVIGFAALPAHRRLLVFLAAIVVMYFGVVSLTHVVHARFLIPILPAVYIGNSIGVSAMAGIPLKIMRSEFLRKYLR
jgi:4-amino-4-deoxy-L-arabinose transferase-like glycosyltransferase